MKKLLLLGCILAAYPTFAQTSLYHDKEINESGPDMMKRGLNDIKNALNEGKNGTASIFCQHKEVPKFKQVYSNNPKFVMQTVIDDEVFKAQFNDLYSNNQIEPDYKYSLFQYKDTALEFFQYPETVVAFCDLPEFRFQLSMMLERVKYLSKFKPQEEK